MLHIMAGYALNTQIIWFWNEENSPKSSYQNFLQVCNIYAFVFKNNKIQKCKTSRRIMQLKFILVICTSAYFVLKNSLKILGSVITGINTCIHINTMDPKYQNSFFETLCSRTDWLTDWLMVKNTIVPWGIIKFSYVFVVYSEKTFSHLIVYW